MNTKSVNRRTFLRGTGGVLLALPHLNLMADNFKGKDVPTRMVCVGTNFGFVPHLFFPKEEGATNTTDCLFSTLDYEPFNEDEEIILIVDSQNPLNKMKFINDKKAIQL